MISSHRRIALLTGASLAALGIATPSFAAPHDAFIPGGTIISGTSTSFSPLTVCTIQATCFHGEVATGIALATATVANVATGRIYQRDTTSTVSLVLNNPVGDFGEVGAIAIAVNPAGAAVADANVVTNMIEQSAIATSSSASVVLNNGGTLLLDALASAVGTNGADASAAITQPAIRQYAEVTTFATGNASAAINNNGTLTISATAVALAGTGFASADASVDEGISQTASNFGSGNATVLLDNNATLNIHANALAVGSAADASASVSDAIDQFAYASTGDASVAIQNDVLGVIDITAHATAIATNGNADADASNSSAIDIYASASSGNASASLLNDGIINISADAFAVATGNILADAFADASASSVIEISASADGVGNLAYAGLVNNNTLTIHAGAVAIAADFASAQASVSDGVMEVGAYASSGANALAVIDNNLLGVIDINATAFANGNFASADASVSSAIQNYATATSGGNATASIANDGSIGIHATATAIAGAFADASATIDSAISQTASASSGGNALAYMSNGTAGVIDIGAHAFASGASAYAFASASDVIYQSASAQTSGNATASIVNNNAINIHATAIASATNSRASASAYVESAISQSASADSGNATVSLSGTGTIDISAVANAISTTGFGYAYASVDTGIYQFARVSTSGAALATADLGGYSVLASANAFGSSATATAHLEDGINQYALNNGVGNATVNLTNSGVMVMSAVANATSTRDSASAFASISRAISQTASANTGDATVSLVNNGTVNISALAHAVANDYALAQATISSGIYQSASATNGNASVSLINAPAMSIVASATATGNSATATAYIATGISQNAFAGGGNASVLVSNADPMLISAHALANADVNDAYAYATVSTGIYQSASAPLGSATATVHNAGTLSVLGTATANGVTFASASGNVGRGIEQSATAGSGVASVLVDNDAGASISIQAGAHAAASSAAVAYARVNTGIDQFASGTAGSLATINNDGAIDVGAIAEATAPFFASASATAYGASQSAIGGTASFVNGTAGTYNVHATALASATAGFANASAFAYGVFQTAAVNVFDNENLFNVNASAVATGSSGSAYASAIGIGGENVFGATTASFDYLNATGASMNVTAVAAAPSTASAFAIGILASQSGTAVLPVNEEIITGTIVNNGTLHVLASAAGMGTTVTALGATITHSSASAVGILMGSGTNNMTVTNTGLLSVDAVTAGNGTTTATGIGAFDNGTGLPAAAGSLLTIINDGGDIIVRESVDGGATWRRGMAIDVATAPNPTVINLLGDGNIYGNVDITTGDNIFVESGTTYFDGIVNPECLPAGGLTAADLDDPLISACGQGTLTIQNGGNLILADPRLTGDPTMYDGPAYVFVETFNVAADGTITFELQPSAGGTQPVGTYPQVFADVANLDGTLVADITPAGGLFADNYFWDNVIDANVRNGGFDGAQCVLDGAYSGSLLLDLDCIEDANDNIDLSLTRTAFNAVPGLNRNGTSVGTGLECIYDTALTGGIASLLGDLFLFTDPVNYNIALNQLSGSVYANYLQSFPSLGVHYNDLLAKATDCEIPALAGSVLECRASAPIHVWGQLDYQWRKADGDIEAGRTKSRRFTGLIGVDANVGNAAIVGVSAGYVTNNVRDSQFGDKADASGMQVGAYGVYDPGAFYVKAMTTYSWYNGDSRRNVNFAGLAPGATFAGNINGDPDVNMWTFGLHGGYRMGIGGNSVLTPYLNYDYVNAKLKSFTESGLDGANLTVLGGRSKHSFLTGGVKWATQMGGMVPEVNLGYRYRMGNSRSKFTAAFLGDTSCDFDVVSASQKRGTFLAGLSVGGKMGPVDLRIGYEGEFNSNITSHSGNFKMVLPIGGHAAPPPPPPPVMAPPPPPPVEVAPPPPPPPPPPAPVERGERGQ